MSLFRIAPAAFLVACAAAPVTLAAPPSPPDDAHLISQEGVGPLKGIAKGQDDAQTEARIAALLASDRTLEVQFDVMDVGIEEEAEEGYFSVVDPALRTEESMGEVLQIFRDDPLTIRVLSDRYATRDGLRVGVKVKDVLAKRPDLTCARESRALSLMTCTSPSEPAITYVIAAKKSDGAKPKPVIAPKTLASRKVAVIVHARQTDSPWR